MKTHSKQVAIISLQVKIISMFGSISNSPDTFPNSHKWRQTGCFCYKGSGSPQNAGCTQVQLLGPTTIKKFRKSAIANPFTNVQIKNYKKGKVDGECEIIEKTQRTLATA